MHTYLQETQTDDTALSSASLPVHVLPDNPPSNASSSRPRCGGPRLDASWVAMVFMAAAPCAFMCQDCESSAVRVMTTSSVAYSRRPPSVPATRRVQSELYSVHTGRKTPKHNVQKHMQPNWDLHVGLHFSVKTSLKDSAVKAFVVEWTKANQQ